MIDLCFNPNALSYAQRIANECGMWIPKAAKEIMGEQNYPKYCEEAKYACQLMTNDLFQDSYRELSSGNIFNEIPLESLNILAKHYDRMHRRYGKGHDYYVNQDFYKLGISEMDTLVYCRNLEAPYDIYNKGRFIDGTDIYKLVKKGTKESTIITKRKPFAKNEIDLESNQCKIEFLETGECEVRIKNEFIGALNRFAIIISVKPPVNHSGCVAMVNDSGNKIFVYAYIFNNDLKFAKKLENRAGQWGNNTIVLAYGFKKADLEQRLMEAAKYIYKMCNCKVSALIRPEMEFEEKINWFKETEEDQQVDFDLFA